MGLRPDEFEAILRRQRGDLLRIFGPLVTGGPIKREVMTREFRNLLHAINEER